jgi:hypothetical protein
VHNFYIYPRIPNLNLEKHWGGKHSFRNSPFKRHSHSLAPCPPTFLAGETGRWRRVLKNVGHQLLYTPPSGHPQDPPLGHPLRPALRWASIVLSVGHPCALCRAPVRPQRAPSTLCWALVWVSVCPACPTGIADHPGRSVGPLQLFLVSTFYFNWSYNFYFFCIYVCLHVKIFNMT